MIKTLKGRVISIEYLDDEISKFTALVGETQEKCINYNRLTGIVEVDDLVLLNITAVDLKLGTGGYHFVIANLTRPAVVNTSQGHIIKLRYTPFQMNCLAPEAQESKHHNIFNEFTSLAGMPVMVGSLHSMLAPCSVFIKRQMPKVKLCYIMTDGGALPIYFSETVRQLKNEGIIDAAITYGNSFGGDFECINIYTALITAKEIIKADLAIVCMGPGIVGTDTRYGFSGIEQGQIIDAVNKLGGYAIQIPRISFSDTRERHYGISHHSITVLKDICCTKANIAIPDLQNEKHMSTINEQIEKSDIKSLHNIIYVDICDIIDVLSDHKNLLNKMGKGLSEESEYFITCAASGKLAINKLNQK